MRPLFCINDTGEKLDEDKFLSLFEVNFSQEQQKKAKEIDTYKLFCDYVGMVGHGGKWTLRVLLHSHWRPFPGLCC